MDYKDQWNENRVGYLYQIARCGDISPAAARVALLFATFLQPEERERVSPKYDWLCKNAHMSRATLSSALKQLVKEGFINIETYHAERSYYSMPFDGNSVWVRENH